MSSVLIGNLLVLFNRKKADILVVFLGNYFVAAMVSLANSPLKTKPTISPMILALAAFAGFLYLFNFFVYSHNTKINGLSISTGVMRAAVIIPTLISALVFGDKISLWTASGIAVVIFSFLLLIGKQKLHNVLWLLLLIIVSGATDLSLKIFSVFGHTPRNVYLFFLFSASYIFTLIWFITTKRKLDWKVLLMGFVLGIPNQLSSFFTLKGLETVPATIVFPIVSSGIVLGSILSDAIFWRRKFSKTDYLALALLIGGIVLINLQ